MMRALWTSGSGMIAQQLNVDIISNNLANVNTTAYKKERAEFKDLIYNTMSKAYILENEGRPVNLQAGNGVMISATVKDFQAGSLEKTDNLLEFAIDGEGFFMVLGPKGDTLYTRDGSFKLSLGEKGKMLTTSEGYPVLDELGNEIIFDYDSLEEEEIAVSLNNRVGIVNFYNRNGLLNVGKNLYAITSASGAPIPNSELLDKNVLRQNYLETSNVQVVEEMVKLIVAQRAYELNSKAIQSSDEMIGIANNLKR
jgi:flagellar basal-body rod protein FlgG